jgi:hypothetical protein
LHKSMLRLQLIAPALPEQDHPHLGPSFRTSWL